MQRHLKAMHRLEVSGGDAERARRLHDSDHRVSDPGHLHEDREQPGDRPLLSTPLHATRPPRDVPYIFGKEITQSLPLPEEHEGNA